jgi:glycosyltransferase involved in cell wall biosynthesis
MRLASPDAAASEPARGDGRADGAGHIGGKGTGGRSVWPPTCDTWDDASSSRAATVCRCELSREQSSSGSELMRILFVSGVAEGGSARSTRELAERLAGRGHDVAILMQLPRAPRRRYMHKRAINLTVKLGTSPLAQPVARAAARIGSRPTRAADAGAVERWETILPENSLATVSASFRPDVVVASSVDRMSWRRMRSLLHEGATPSVLYVREQNAFGHLTISGAPPDLLVANAEVHAETAASLGYRAVTVPSLVSVDECLVDSSRERVLYVNPTPLYGLDIALNLAAARPDVPFAFAESARIDRDAWSALVARAALHPNIELRRFTPDPRRLYADARVLLAPYRTNGRPRVMLEAHANGIPVLGSGLPAVREAVGPGGLVVDPDEPVGAWAAALDRILEPSGYAEFVEAARRHARRPEVDPDAIAERFERALADLLGARHPVLPEG